MKIKTITYHIPCFVGLVFGFFFFCINITSPDFSKVPGDLGDARFCTYVLENAHLFFTGKTPEFWNAPFLYPEKNAIAYSDNFLGTAPFYSLFRLSGKDVQDSFQYWFILMSLFNYLSCYVLLFYLFKNPYSAAVGALIFAFSIALQSQISHAQTFPRFPIPLCVLAALMYLKNLQPRYFALTLVILVYQFYCGIYLGFLLMITIFFLFLFSFIYRFKIYRERIKEKRWWIYNIGAVAFCVLLLIPLMLPYVEKATDARLYPYWEVVNTIPSIRSFFYSHHGSYLWKFLENTGAGYEAYWDHQIFPGAIALLAFFCFSIMMARKYIFRKNEWQSEQNYREVILFFTGSLVFIFFLRYQDYSLYKIIFLLPGFNSMRALERIINIELLFFAIATAYFCNFIFKYGKPISFIIFVVALCLVFVDNSIGRNSVNVYEKSVSSRRIMELESKIGNLKSGSIISYEPDIIEGSVIYYQLDAMLASQEKGIKCINGYTANPPDFYSYYWLSPSKVSRRIWVTIKDVHESTIYVIK